MDEGGVRVGVRVGSGLGGGWVGLGLGVGSGGGVGDAGHGGTLYFFYRIIVTPLRLQRGGYCATAVVE